MLRISEHRGRQERAITVLREEINTALRDAMKARNTQRVSTLRLVNAAIKNADIEAQLSGRPLLSDDAVLALLQKMIKQRHESIAIYDKAGRKELADRERGEIEVINEYLPQQMSEQQMRTAIAAVIDQLGAHGIKDMGKVMAALKADYVGKMDFGTAGAMVRGMLAG